MHRTAVLLSVAVVALAAVGPVPPGAAATLAGNDPIGSVEVAESYEPGTVVVTGWSVDPDTAAPVDVRVDVVGVPGSPPLHYSLGPATLPRPEVGKTYDGAGDQHGFDARLELPPGTVPTAVAVYAVNSPGTAGSDQMIGSMPIDPVRGPFGSLESITATQDGYVRLRGWIADGLTTESYLTVWVGSNVVWAPGWGSYHLLPSLLGYGVQRGFDTLVGGPPSFTPGPHEVCVKIGTRVGLGCRTVTVAEDRYAPDTSFTSVPAAVDPDRDVAFYFASTEDGTFACRWGAGEWSPCTSPVNATVAPGSYTFAVRSTDAWGNTDPTPAAVAFTVTQPLPAWLVVRAEAVRRASRLRVDVDPDSLGWNYRFRVDQRVDGAWHRAARTTTLGLEDTRTLDLPRGRYRVVVPAQHGMKKAVDRARLRR